MNPEDLKQITETVDKGFATVGSQLGAQFAQLNETAKQVLTPKPEDIVLAGEKAPAAEAETAEMKQPLAGITKLEVWDIPVGQALVGGFIAVFSSELIDGFLAAQSSMIRGLIKLAGAGVAVKWGSGLLGSTGSKAVALLLAYDGLRSIVPIDEWASRLSGGIKPLTGGGLGGRAGMEREKQPVGGNGHTADYYEALKGGVR